MATFLTICFFVALAFVAEKVVNFFSECAKTGNGTIRMWILVIIACIVFKDSIFHVIDMICHFYSVNKVAGWK